MIMSNIGYQLTFENNDIFNLNSDYLGHIFNHNINNIENPVAEKKIDIVHLYNEKETFQNNIEKFQKKINLNNINLDKNLNNINLDENLNTKKYNTKNSLEKLQIYYFIIYLFFLWFCFFLFYVSCFF